MIINVIKILRLHQYVKNLFVFLPAFFAFKLHQPDLFLKAFIGFSAFCCVASAVYILNDWQDRFEDAKHPDKRNRPLASGKITPPVAFAVFLGMLAGGFGLAWFVSDTAFFFLLFYFVLNVAYSFSLKHIPIIDIFIIATGFVIRLFVGATVTHIALVNWIIVMTFLLALFLALAKRRDDVLIYVKTSHKTRRVIDGYNLKFLDASMVMTGAIVVLAYILWSISAEVVAKHDNQHIYLTSIFVILGIFRYMQITFVDEKSGSPTKVLLRDRFIQLTLFGWIASFILILYF